MPKKTRCKGFRHARKQQTLHMQAVRHCITKPAEKETKSSASTCTTELSHTHCNGAPPEPYRISNAAVQLYTPERLVTMVGNADTEIPDDVIEAAINLMKAHNQSASTCVGPYSPAELHLMASGIQQPVQTLAADRNFITVHPLANHWVTSYYRAENGQIYVYDSQMSDFHLQQVKLQLQCMFGTQQANFIHYPVVTQQHVEPICGVMAIAFAFSCFLRKNPTLYDYDITKARMHLKKCFMDGSIKEFPAAKKRNEDNLSTCISIDAVQHPTQYHIKPATISTSDTNKQKESSRNISFKTNFLNTFKIPKLCNTENNLVSVSSHSHMKTVVGPPNENPTQGKNCDKSRKRKLYMKHYMKQKRQNSSYRQLEQQKDNQNRKQKRKNVQYRQTEQEYNTQQRRQKRKIPEYRETEQEYNTQQRKQKRKIPEYRETEQEYNTQQRKQKRKIPEYRQNEQRHDTQQRKQKRKIPEYRETEQEYNTQQRKQKRKIPEYRQNEQRHDTQQRKQKRKIPEYRENEQGYDTHRRKEKRKIHEYKETEQENNTQQRRQKRKIPEYRETEQEYNTRQRKQKRKIPEYRETEQQYNTQQRKQKRKIPEYRESEQEYDTQQRKKKRKIPEYRETEQEYNTQQRKQKRKIPEYRETEQQYNTKQRKQRRQSPEYRQAERKKDCSIKQIHRKKQAPQDIQTLVTKFHKIISIGPEYTCSSCNQLFYRHSVLPANSAFSRTDVTTKMRNVIERCVTTLCKNTNKKWICTTCFSYLKKSKIPPCSQANKMVFPEQGPLHQLNHLELILLAPVLPFMRIHQAPRGKQYRIHGNLVVVPADVANTVKSLPRMTNNTATIKAKLKRRLRYKHHVYSLNIRPCVILEAAKFLSERGTLYKQHNIKFDLDWSDSITCNDEMDTLEDERSSCSSQAIDTSKQSSQSNLELDSIDNQQNIALNDDDDCVDDCIDNIKQINCSGVELTDKQNQQTSQNHDSDDDWNEIQSEETNSGLTDTLLTAPDFVEPAERDSVYSFAPAEGAKPTSVFIQKNSEELCFPGIFCGKARASNDERDVPVSYSEIVKSELRSADRRCATNVDNIFFKVKKLQMKQLIDQTNIAVRKFKTKGQTLTAKDVRKDSAAQLINSDQGYKILRTLRGSPPYFQAVSKDLLAMIRHLGPGTFFFTLSAAETQWQHLLHILGKVTSGTDYTDAQLQNLTWDQKCRLIQSDPVTCSRHYDYSLQCFMREILKSNLQPLGEITDSFYRIEFQQRGSPHAHMLLWCQDAPVYGEDSDIDVIKFIDTHITCKRPPPGSEQRQLVDLQLHRHSHTCRKKATKKCRFGFPKPPLPSTQILQPLEKEDQQKYKDIWKFVENHLQMMQEGEEISFSDFLKKLQLSEADYVMAIRSSISKPAIFLKRTPSEIRINAL